MHTRTNKQTHLIRQVADFQELLRRRRPSYFKQQAKKRTKKNRRLDLEVFVVHSQAERLQPLSTPSSVSRKKTKEENPGLESSSSTGSRSRLSVEGKAFKHTVPGSRSWRHYGGLSTSRDHCSLERAQRAGLLSFRLIAISKDAPTGSSR